MLQGLLKNQRPRPCRFSGMVGVISASLLLAACTSHFRLEALRAELAAIQSQRSWSPDLLTHKEDGAYQDLRGAIHVHSRLSYDSEGTPEEMVRAAKAAGLDYVILTDHQSPLIFQEGPTGQANGVVLIRGMEIIKKCRGGADRCDDLLAVAIEQYFDHEPLSFQEVVREIRRQGGLSFIAHPRGWRDWSVEGLTGMEIYDTLDDAVDKKWKYPKYFLDILYSYKKYPEEVFISILDRPRWHLEKWDALTMSRRVVGIAGNDAHQNIRLAGRQVDPYGLSFRFVSTHVLTKGRDERAILDALGRGHAYAAFDLLAEATGFWFGLRPPHQKILMGDETPFEPGMELMVRLPLPARVDLLRNGELIEQCYCAQFHHPVGGPGVFRVEAFLKIQDRWRPWIFSNPVYIRAP